MQLSLTQLQSMTTTIARSRLPWVWVALLAATIPMVVFLGGFGPLTNNRLFNGRATADEIVSVEIVGNDTTVNYTYNTKHRYYKDLPDWCEKYPFLPKPNEVPDDKRVCMVHVGESSSPFI